MLIGLLLLAPATPATQEWVVPRGDTSGPGANSGESEEGGDPDGVGLEEPDCLGPRVGGYVAPAEPLHSVEILRSVLDTLDLILW